jgi:hypothetical protein
MLTDRSAEHQLIEIGMTERAGEAPWRMTVGRKNAE